MTAPTKTKLTRGDPAAAGILRRRCGRGFRYLGPRGGDFTAKDFRTWHATVLAAVGLAVSEPAAGSDAARKRAVARVEAAVLTVLRRTRPG